MCRLGVMKKKLLKEFFREQFFSEVIEVLQFFKVCVEYIQFFLFINEFFNFSLIADWPTEARKYCTRDVIPTIYSSVGYKLNQMF